MTKADRFDMTVRRSHCPPPPLLLLLLLLLRLLLLLLLLLLLPLPLSASTLHLLPCSRAHTCVSPCGPAAAIAEICIALTIS